MVKLFSFGTLNPVLLSMAAAVLATETASEAAAIVEAPLAQQVNYSGVATFYYQQGRPGSCGHVNQDSAYVASLAPFWFNQNLATCGRSVFVQNNGGGQNNTGVGNNVTVTLADTCPGCDVYSISLSTGAFAALTGGHLDPPGKINVVGHFV